MRKNEYYKREIKVLTKLDNPHIVKFHEFFEDKKYVHLVTDLYDGGCLEEHIEQAGCFSEKEAAKIFKQLLEALHHCH